MNSKEMVIYECVNPGEEIVVKKKKGELIKVEFWRVGDDASHDIISFVKSSQFYNVPVLFDLSFFILLINNYMALTLLP